MSVQKMSWTRQMAAEMALGYAHEAHAAAGAGDQNAAVYASISVAWSHVAALIDKDGDLLLRVATEKELGRYGWLGRAGKEPR